MHLCSAIIVIFVPGLTLGGAEQKEDDGVDGQYGRAQQEGDPPSSQGLLECDKKPP